MPRRRWRSGPRRSSPTRVASGVAQGDVVAGADRDVVLARVERLAAGRARAAEADGGLVGQEQHPDGLRTGWSRAWSPSSTGRGSAGGSCRPWRTRTRRTGSCRSRGRSRRPSRSRSLRPWRPRPRERRAGRRRRAPPPRSAPSARESVPMLFIALGLNGQPPPELRSHPLLGGRGQSSRLKGNGDRKRRGKRPPADPRRRAGRDRRVEGGQEPLRRHADRAGARGGRRRGEQGDRGRARGLRGGRLPPARARRGARPRRPHRPRPRGRARRDDRRRGRQADQDRAGRGPAHASAP